MPSLSSLLHPKKHDNKQEDKLENKVEDKQEISQPTPDELQYEARVQAARQRHEELSARQAQLKAEGKDGIEKPNLADALLAAVQSGVAS